MMMIRLMPFYIAVGAAAATPACSQVPAGSQLPDSIAIADAQAFVAAMKAGAWQTAEAMVAPELHDRLGAAQIEAVWAQLRSGLGELGDVTLHSVAPADSMVAVELRANYAAQPMLMRIVVSPSRRVVGYWVAPLPAQTPPGQTASQPQTSAQPGTSAPPYVDTSRFREESVEIGADPWLLPGTLTIPVAPGRHPVVILVHGSGPQDRDETVGGAKVFRDLAWGLASRGIAVLRYDKRTLVHGAKMGSGVTVDSEVIEDALSAVGLVRRHEAIDAQRVFVLGHSLGGQLAPEIARRDGRLAGALLLAAPGRPIETLLIEQVEYIKALPANGAPEVQTQLDAALVQARRLVSDEAAADEMILGAPVSYFRDLRRHDAVATAQQLDVPLLVLQGERDYQVTMTDFDAFRAALGSRPKVSLRSFPSLNHLFIAGSGASTPTEYMQPGFVAGEVIDVIAGWVTNTR